MSKSKSSALLRLVESEDEDSDILAAGFFVKSKIPAVRMPAAKRGIATAANRVTKTATKGTRSSGRAATRKPLIETETNAPADAPAGGETRAAADDIAIPDPPKATRGRARGARAAKVAANAHDLEESAQVEDAAPPAKRNRKTKATVIASPKEPEVPETQPEDMLIDEIPETQRLETIVEDGYMDDEGIDNLPASNSGDPFSIQRPWQPAHIFAPTHRPVHASDSERQDPALRRRIGELSRKYDNLQTRYKDLCEIGIKEAERKYNDLRKQEGERASTADRLIATLKAQLAAETEQAKECERLRLQVKESNSRADGLHSKLGQMEGSLTEAKAEIKALSCKITASRAAEAASTKIPGSAIKGNTVNNRMLANAEASVQTAQLKEDLYSDLTGLIIRGIKRESSGQVYDCIQTGRNGTLHFKLSVSTVENFDDAQFLYMPQLDPNRDRALIDVLPDYLSEEITFPRHHAAKFYARVMKALTERVE